MKDFTFAIENNKQRKDVNLFSNRGSAYLALEQYEKALEDFSKSIEMSPQSAKFHFNKARALLSLNKSTEACQEFEMANSLDSSFAKMAANAISLHKRKVTMQQEVK